MFPSDGSSCRSSASRRTRSRRSSSSTSSRSQSRPTSSSARRIFRECVLSQPRSATIHRGRLAAHLVGYVGEISAEELEDRDSDEYGLGDRIGKTGIELGYDRFLRGDPGLAEVRFNALGQQVRQRSESIAPTDGNRIKLTIDSELQAAAEQALRDGSFARARAMMRPGPPREEPSSHSIRATVRSERSLRIRISIRASGQAPERPTRLAVWAVLSTTCPV